MMFSPMQNIQTTVIMDPVELVIHSIKTKQICIQDILNKNNVVLQNALKTYEPPKLVDMIKQGMTAVAIEDIMRDAEEKAKEIDKSNSISNIKTALEMGLLDRGVVVPPQNVSNLLSPPEVNVPIATYTPYMGGQSGGNVSFPFGFQLPVGPNQFDSATMLEGLKSLSLNLKDMFLKMYSHVARDIQNTHKDVLINRDVNMKGNKYVVDTIMLVSKAMSKSLADYFRNMVVHLIKNGCAYFPVGLAGDLHVRVTNTTPMPQGVSLFNISILSGDTVISKPSPISLFAAPMETDTVNIPVIVENVDAVEYILSHRGKGQIPITIKATVNAGLKTSNESYTDNVVVK